MTSIHDKGSRGTMDQVQSVYMCTFCQVFSSTLSTVVHHIRSTHTELLPVGTAAENFVSKLNALQNESYKKQIRKSREPKKSWCENGLKVEKLESKKSVPFPKSDGLFWCEKCHKCFKKARQLVKHICLDTDEEDNYFEEASLDSDITQSYKTYIIIDPEPWSKRTKFKKAEDLNVHCTARNEGKNEDKSVTVVSQNALINWRVDPSYLPVFQNEEEKTNFKKHLKSIDYSFVDVLFDEKESPITSNTVYICKKCKKTATSLSHIRMHCLIHTDIKPFTCPKCSYETNSKGSLYIHMRKHTGNMFHCSYCNFKSTKKVHVLDHEATHSAVPQICKLCKNTYKTLRSLIAHVKRYHDNSGGKKYIKSLSPERTKVNTIHCNICKKKFTSISTFEKHSQMYHVPDSNLQPKESLKSNTNEVVSENTTSECIQIQESSCLLSPDKNLECENSSTSKDSLTELVLRNLFQQSQSKPIIFNGLYDESEIKKMFAATVLLNALETESISEQLASLSEANHFEKPKEPDIEECDKTFSILDECLRSPNFEKECLRVSFEETALPTECQQEFQLSSVQPILQNEAALQNQKVEPSENSSNTVSQLHQKFSSEKETEENDKSAEIKLFEKCHRAPAYVCCVCSAIFICSSTLKVHLKDHIDNSGSNFMEQEEDFNSKISDDCSELNNVCPLLIEPTNSYSEGEKELEKLYTSSMDMIWYLPEVSVVLENDPALFDSVLDDISNFPINDKYDEEEELNVKDSADSVLECFNEL